MPSPDFNDKSLLAALDAANITHTTERAMFIAQMAHESGGFKYDEEVASGAAYEGRADLGNTQSGDGVRFKGRGYIQLTGRANYQHFGEVIAKSRPDLGLEPDSLVKNPDLAKRPDVAAAVATAYWDERVDKNAARAGNVEVVTKNINGGYNGLEDRRQYFNKFHGNLPEAQAASAAAGLTVPTNHSLDAVIADLQPHDPELAAQLQTIQRAYADKDTSHLTGIAEAMSGLRTKISNELEAADLAVDNQSMFIGLHIGPYSATALLKASNDQPLSDIDGLNKESAVKFLKEIGSDKTIDEVTAAQARQMASQYFNEQVQVASVTAKQQSQQSEQKQDTEFFGELIEEMMQTETGGLLFFMVTMIATLAFGEENAFSKAGQQAIGGTSVDDTQPVIDQQMREQQQTSNTPNLSSAAEAEVESIRRSSDNIESSNANTVNPSQSLPKIDKAVLTKS